MGVFGLFFFFDPALQSLLLFCFAYSRIVDIMVLWYFSQRQRDNIALMTIYAKVNFAAQNLRDGLELYWCKRNENVKWHGEASDQHAFTTARNLHSAPEQLLPFCMQNFPNSKSKMFSSSGFWYRQKSRY